MLIMINSTPWCRSMVNGLLDKSGFNRKVEAALIYDSDELFLFI